MENNILFLDNSSFNKTITVNDNQQQQIYIIDLMENNVDFNLNITVYNNCKVDVIISSLNRNSFNKKFNVFINHVGDDSTSICKVHGINKDQSKTYFNLEAIIKKESINNYCEQSIRGVLLSDESQITGRPNLIIDTNNIKAKHALAIGRLNQNHIFYLQNKGLTKSDAIKMLIISYFNIILHNIENEEKKEQYINKIYEAIGTIN